MRPYKLTTLAALLASALSLPAAADEFYASITSTAQTPLNLTATLHGHKRVAHALIITNAGAANVTATFSKNSAGSLTTQTIIIVPAASTQVIQLPEGITLSTKPKPAPTTWKSNFPYPAARLASI